MIIIQNYPKVPIKCNVQNCTYNQEKACYAKDIKVDAIGDMYANTPDGTCCSTFTNKQE